MKAANWVRPLLLILFLLNAPTLFGQQTPFAGNASGPQQLSSTQASPSPCLTPSPADNSTTQLQATTTNATLAGNVLPDVKAGRAQFKNALNQARLLRTELVLKIRNANQFQKCLDAINDPTSSYYGQFLNATTLKPYLPTPGQRLSIIRYLTQHGFNVTSGPSPLVLNVAGSVSVIQHVFGLKLGIYQRNTNSSFYAADSDPKMPQNLAALVTGITGLDNYTSIKPSESPCSGPYCPQGIQVGYSLQSLYSSYNGAGQKVAIVDAPGDPNPCCGPSSALHVYDRQYGIQDPSTFQVFCGSGTAWTTCGSSVTYNPGWGSEAAMDIEAAHAVALGAGILLFYGTGTSDLVDAIDYVAQNHLASIVSNSWTYGCPGTPTGSCSDTQLSSLFVSSIDLRLAFDAAQGLTILFASGDEGARPDGSTLGTEFPASDPNVLAIGATNLVLAGCGTSTCTGYASETGASISGGGYSGYFSEPSWQTTNIGTKSGRAVPDVSILGYSPNFWVYSTASDKCGTGGNSPGWFRCAGTSLSTPLWAGFLAIALQIKGTGSFGNIGPWLYQTANSPSYSTIFHDITSGLNNGYSAALGWDPVTGWGTPIASSLAYVLAGTITITVTSNPTGSGYVTVDSTSTTTPQTFSWIIGSTHTVSANSPVACGSGCQYTYASWNDGGGQSHTITVSASVTTYTANFVQQFMLTTVVNPAAAGTLTVASGWQTAGSTVPVGESAASGYNFYYWSLDGSNVGSGSAFSVVMNSAHTLTAYFRGSSTISMQLSSNSITLGAEVTLSGTLTPMQSSPGIPNGATIVLSYSLGGGYGPFIITTTASGGGYSVSWVPPYPASSYSLQASWGGDANYVGSASSVSALTVTGTPPPQPQLLLTGPASASRGSTASFTVLVTNPTSPTLTTTLYVEIMGPNGYYYFDTQQVTVPVSSTGRFEFDWQVPSTISAGSYVVNVGLIPPTLSSISQTQITIT